MCSVMTGAVLSGASCTRRPFFSVVSVNSTRSGAAEADPQHNESDSSANAAKVRGIFDSPHALGNEQGALGEDKDGAGAETATLDQGGAGKPRTRAKRRAPARRARVPPHQRRGYKDSSGSRR